MKVGIIGVGVIGGAMVQVLGKSHQIYPYDKYKKSCNSEDNLRKLVKESEVVFLCVPTPMKKSGEMDCYAIYDSLNLLKEEVDRQKRNPKEILVVIRSTTIPGTTDKMAKEYSFKFASNPEFLRQDRALEDMKQINRIVFGVEDEESKDKLLSLYKQLFPQAKYTIVNRKTAEMIKYVANVILASQITVANEIYQLCQHIGVNYDSIREAILQDERIGKNIRVPGPDGDIGFGGKCFPKDFNALIYFARESGYQPHLLEAVWAFNERVRKDKDWLDILGATSEKIDFERE